MIFISDILDIAKKNYICQYDRGNIEIINRGTKMDTSGEWEEYIVKRWIYKDEPRGSNKNN